MPHASCMCHVRGCLATATTADLNHHEHSVEVTETVMSAAIGVLETDVPLPHFQLLLHVLEEFKSGGMFQGESHRPVQVLRLGSASNRDAATRDPYPGAHEPSSPTYLSHTHSTL